MKLYIAGPMRGHKDYNWAAFEEAEQQLRALHHEVLSPTLLWAELGFDHAPTVYMKRNIADLLTCEGIVLLEGWHQSVGASAEAAVALVCGLPFFTLHGGKLTEYVVAGLQVNVRGYEQPESTAQQWLRRAVGEPNEY